MEMNAEIKGLRALMLLREVIASFDKAAYTSSYMDEMTEKLKTSERELSSLLYE